MSSIKQTVSYISVKPKGRSAALGFDVSYDEREVELVNKPHAGISYVKTSYSAPCGSDGGVHGYYWGGRFQRDVFEEKEKLEENLDLLANEGLVSSKPIRKQILHIPNHEGAGVITATTNNVLDTSRKIGTFLPIISKNKKGILGFKHSVLEFNFQQLRVGQRVIIDAALRCDNHWEIKAHGFPDNCHRETGFGHIRKRVPGHMEFPGFSYYAALGLPYPNQMLTPVPNRLDRWISENPSKREAILVLVEPLSCCIEAFHPSIMKNEKPQIITILGDGPNALLLTLTATTAFPESVIYVVGRTGSKLSAIASINPDKIVIIQERKEQGMSGYEQLAKTIKGKKRKIEILIPTFEASTLSEYVDIVEKDGRIIVWAAGQVGQRDPFDGVGDPQKIHHSYGGKNKMEWSALQFLETLTAIYPKRISALLKYPFQVFNLRDGAEVFKIWLLNRGTYQVQIDGRLTSAKLIFKHEEAFV